MYLDTKEARNNSEILVVEDSLTQATQLEILLEENGYRASVVGDGEQALAFMNRRKPSLVISDIIMPKMDGFDLCSHIVKDEALREIPVIFLSQLSSPQDIERGLASGAVAFIVKPYTQQGLLTKISSIIGRVSTWADPDKPMNLLVVEDSPTQAEYLRGMLDQHGFKVTIAGNGRTALEAMRERKPDVVISDALMPEMDGYDMCRRMRQSLDLRNTPVVMLTSLLEPCDVIRGIVSGVDYYLTKPFEDELLLTKLDFILGDGGSREQDHLLEDIDFMFDGKSYCISMSGRRLLNLLLSTYENAVWQNRKLREAQLELKEMNEHLSSMTEQLSESNNELKAFAYSVSHDLRAPLRAIDGFSQMLMEDYGDTLDDDGQRRLQVIRDSVREMGELIDDLLAFSRLSHREMTTSMIDMTSLAREVFKKVQSTVEGGAVRLDLKALPPVKGDLSMMREVFINLFSNAVKYSHLERNPVIEMDGTVGGNKNIYRIKDNGVGFDMAYVDKVFEVFQRLHGTDQFEGTGIGLALVKRIIMRHGGRVWAEGKVNEGATFYFALPK